MILPGGIIGGALPSVALTDTGNYTAGSVNPVTFSSRALGTAGRRWIVIALGWVGSPTVSSVTVAGVTATFINARTQGVFNVALYIASVPNGTTGDVVVTFNTATTNVHVGVYALHNLRSATPVDSAVASSGVLSSKTVNVNADVSARGVVVSVFGTSGGTPTLVGLTDRADIRIATQSFYAAQYTGGSAEAPRTMGWTNDGIVCAALASFR